MLHIFVILNILKYYASIKNGGDVMIWHGFCKLFWFKYDVKSCQYRVV